MTVKTLLKSQTNVELTWEVPTQDTNRRQRANYIVKQTESNCVIKIGRVIVRTDNVFRKSDFLHDHHRKHKSVFEEQYVRTTYGRRMSCD